MRRLLTTRVTIFSALIAINILVVLFFDPFVDDAIFYQITWLLRVSEWLGFPVFDGSELLKLPNRFGVVLICIGSVIALYVYYLLAGFFARRLSRNDT